MVYFSHIFLLSVIVIVYEYSLIRLSKLIFKWSNLSVDDLSFFIFVRNDIFDLLSFKVLNVLNSDCFVIVIYFLLLVNKCISYHRFKPYSSEIVSQFFHSYKQRTNEEHIAILYQVLCYGRLSLLYYQSLYYTKCCIIYVYCFKMTKCCVIPIAVLWAPIVTTLPIVMLYQVLYYQHLSLLYPLLLYY